MMSWKKIAFVCAALVIVLGASYTFWSQPKAIGETIEVYKSPTWGCCTGWVDHLEREGFNVKSVNMSYDELNALKTKNGVPRRLWSCHTGFIRGYIVEGHIPGEVILRFLKEKPAVAGIGVPGMPTGSPGMEGPNPRPYNVFTFDKSGQIQYYSQVKPW